VKTKSIILMIFLSFMLISCDDDDEASNNSNTNNIANAVCGNFIIEGEELCDGTAFITGIDCETVNVDATTYIGGVLGCTDCGSYDVSGCFPDLCGNNTQDNDEVCDGDTVACSTIDASFISGNAECVSTCDEYDTSQCVMNNMVGEACESAIQCGGIDAEATLEATCLTVVDTGFFPVTFVDGYCTSECVIGTPDPCEPVGGVCTDLAGQGSVCLVPCTEVAQCRAGYQCGELAMPPVGGPKYCIPIYK
jgi:hypothetical protein